MANKDKVISCSFCGKSSNEVERIIIGPGVNICNECISLCCDLLEDEGLMEPKKSSKPQRKGNREEDINILSPMQIKQGLDKYVIGQDDAKIALSVAVYMTVCPASTAKTVSWITVWLPTAVCWMAM